MAEVEHIPIVWDTDFFTAEYRWDKDSNYARDYQFNSGDAICVDPFEELWPIYGVFEQYITNDIVEIYIPPSSEGEVLPTWFCDEAGNYYIHQGYLKPE